MKIVLMVSHQCKETLGEKDNKMQGKDGPELIKKAQKKKNTKQNRTEQNKKAHCGQKGQCFQKAEH